MLSKLNRLNLKTDFKFVSSGKSLSTPHLRLFLKKGDNTVPRIGVAITTKIFQKATDRSRAKRVVFASFTNLLPDLESNINIIALPKASVLEVKSDELFQELKKVFKND